MASKSLLCVLLLCVVYTFCEAAPTSNSTTLRPATIIVRTQPQVVSSVGNGRTTIGRHSNTSTTVTGSALSPAGIKGRPVRSVVNGTTHDESSEEEKDDASSETGSPKNPLYRPHQSYQPQFVARPVVISQEESGAGGNSENQRISPSAGIIGNSGVRTAAVTNQTRPAQPASVHKLFGIVSDDQ